MDFDRGSFDDLGDSGEVEAEIDLPQWARRPDWARHSVEEFVFPSQVSAHAAIEGTVNFAVPSSWSKITKSPMVTKPSLSDLAAIEDAPEPWAMLTGNVVPRTPNVIDTSVQQTNLSSAGVTQMSKESYRHREKWHGDLGKLLFPAKKFEHLESTVLEDHTHNNSWRERARCNQCVQSSHRLFVELRNSAATKHQCTSMITGIEDRLFEEVALRNERIAACCKSIVTFHCSPSASTPLEEQIIRERTTATLQSLLVEQEALEESFSSSTGFWSILPGTVAQRLRAICAWVQHTTQFANVFEQLKLTLGLNTYREALENASSPFNITTPGKSSSSFLFVVKELKRVGLRKLMDRLDCLTRPVLQKAAADESDPALIELQRKMGLPPYSPMVGYCTHIPLVLLTDAMLYLTSNCPKSQLSVLSAEFYLSTLKDALIEAQSARNCNSLDKMFDTQVVRRIMLNFEAAFQHCFEMYLSLTRLRLAAILQESEKDKDAALSVRLQLVLEKEWEFASEMSEMVAMGDQLVLNTFTILVEMLCKHLGNHVKSIAELRTTAVQMTNITFMNVNQETCRRIKVLLHETRRRFQKVTDLLRNIHNRRKLAAMYELTSTTTQLFTSLEEHYNLIQYNTEQGRPTSVIEGCFVFAPKSARPPAIEAVLGLSGTKVLTQTTCSHLLVVNPGSAHSPTFSSTISTPNTATSLSFMREDDNGPGGMDLSWLGGGGNESRPMMASAQATPINGQAEASKWTGSTIFVSGESGMTLVSMERGLLLLTPSRDDLKTQRKRVSDQLRFHVRLYKEDTVWTQEAEDAQRRKRTCLLELCRISFENIVLLQNHLIQELSFRDIAFPKLMARTDALQSGYGALFQLLHNSINFIEGDLASVFRKLLFESGLEWLHFAHDCPSSGVQGIPRWVRDGFEYILFIAKPGITRHLAAEEFDMFEIQVQSVVSAYNMNETLNFRRNLSGTTEDPVERLGRDYGAMSLTPMSLTSSSTFAIDGSAPPRRTLGEIDAILAKGMYVSQFSALRGCDDEDDEEEPVVGNVVTENGLGRQSTEDEAQDADLNTRWQLGKLIGEGSGGEVYMGVNNQTKEVVAVKKVRLPTNVTDRKNALKNLRTEFKLVSEINSAHLIKYFALEMQKDGYLLFMEYCPNRSLWDCDRDNPFPSLMLRKYTAQVLLGLQALHDRGVVHRDLKGDNVFLDANMICKIGDFGTCARLQDPHKTQYGELNELVGTIVYMAPEVIKRQNKEGHGRKCDVWSLGCVVYEMAAGARPYSDRFESVDAKAFQHQLIYFIGSDRLLRPSDPEHLDEEGCDFLAHCFEREPSARSDVCDLLEHPFVKPCVVAHGSGLCPCGCQSGSS